jgi:7-keto-8-aminopelargonate synthetase-like enzyme
MADFYQHGTIATLHRLGNPDYKSLEEEMVSLARTSPLALVLPCHARDLKSTALAAIVAELRELKINKRQIDRIVQRIKVLVRRVNKAEFEVQAIERQAGADVVVVRAELKKALSVLGEVSGDGLYFTVEHPQAEAIARKLLERNIRVGLTEDKALRFCPPLNVSAHDISRLATLLREVAV